MDAPRLFKILLVPLFAPLAYLYWLAQFSALCVSAILPFLAGKVLIAFDAKVSFSYPFIIFNRGLADLPTLEVWLLFLAVGGGILYLYFVWHRQTSMSRIYIKND